MEYLTISLSLGSFTLESGGQVELNLAGGNTAPSADCATLAGKLRVNVSVPTDGTFPQTQAVTVMNVPSTCVSGDFSSVAVVVVENNDAGCYVARSRGGTSAVQLSVEFLDACHSTAPYTATWSALSLVLLAIVFL